MVSISRRQKNPGSVLKRNKRYVLDWFANIMDKNPRTPAVFRTKTVVLAGEDIVFMGAHVVNRKL